MEKLVCSAIKFQIVGSDYFHIMCGKRHADIFETMFKLRIQYEKTTHEQGFLTSNDRFVDRYEAVDIALAAGQISDTNIKILYSEDVWEE